MLKGRFPDKALLERRAVYFTQMANDDSNIQDDQLYISLLMDTFSDTPGGDG